MKKTLQELANNPYLEAQSVVHSTSDSIAVPAPEDFVKTGVEDWIGSTDSSPSIRQDTAPSVSTGFEDMFGSQDIIIPRIYQQQSGSRLCKSGDARPGEWLDSVTNEVLAKKDEQLEIITFGAYKKLHVFFAQKGSSDFEYQESLEVTPQNANLRWKEETPDGTIKRTLTYNYFVLLPKYSTAMPYIISFKNTKLNAAKNLNTMLFKLSKMTPPKAAYASTFLLKSIIEPPNDWYTIEVKQGRETTAEERRVCASWAVEVNNMASKVKAEPEGHEE